MAEAGDSKSGIRQIAAKAGVSTATVSRVLNGGANVSAATREAVLKVVTQNNYRPNAAAKALATNRTHTVAAVIPTLEHSIFAVFMNALEDELAAAGYSLVIATHRFDYQTELRRCNEVLKLGAEALIVSGTEHDPALAQLLTQSGVPCLYTSVYDPQAAIPSMGYDNQGLAFAAMSYLAELGHRKISVLHGPITHNDRMQARLAGVKSAQASIENLELELLVCPIGAQAGTQAVDGWVNNGDLPDACLCLADIFAFGVLQGAYRHHLNIPEQISVMGFENLDWTAHCTPRLTTVALPAAEMGKAAAQSVVKHLDENQPLEHKEFSGQIIERDSTLRTSTSKATL